MKHLEHDLKNTLTEEQLKTNFEEVVRKCTEELEVFYVPTSEGSLVLMGVNNYNSWMETVDVSHDTAILDLMMQECTFEEVIDRVEKKYKESNLITLPEDYYMYLLMLARNNYKLNKRLRTDIRRLIGALYEIKEIVMPLEEIKHLKKTYTRDDLNAPIQTTSTVSDEQKEVFNQILRAAESFKEHLLKKEK